MNMTHITLIRHGQANTGARDEASYDRLSDLGHQQARWLGAHLRDTRAYYTRVYCGTLTRHIETAAGMELENVVQDPRLNEMEYFNLAEAMQDQHGLEIPTEREGFVDHMADGIADQRLTAQQKKVTGQRAGHGSKDTDQQWRQRQGNKFSAAHDASQ